MDVKHRKAYARVKQTGTAEPKLLNDGVSLTALMLLLARELAAMPSRYNDIHIEISFTPMGEHSTQQERDFGEIVAGLDLSTMTQESDEEAEAWANSPINPLSPSYDPLLAMYRQCAIPSFRILKTPEDLALLRKHVESTYTGTPEWDGSHRW